MTLLGIDDAAELRALAAADVPDPEQVAVECVRAALALGAQRVAVQVSARGFRLQAPGAWLDEPIRAALALVLDGRAPAGRRARALEPISGGPAAPLAVLLHPAVQRVQWTTGFGCAVALRGASPARVRERLQAACRFSRAPVSVDDARALPRRPLGAIDAGGFPRDAPFDPLAAPERGGLALLADGESPRATLLVHGVVRTVRPLVARLPFEAVVECAEPDGAVPDPTALRERADRAAPAWERQALELLVRHVQSPAASPARDALLVGLFLHAVEAGLAPAGAPALPAVPAFVEGRRVRLSLDTVAARAGQGPVRVAEPGAATSSAGGCVLELTVPARAALQRLHGVRFEDVAAHPGRAPWRARWRAGVQRVQALAGGAAARPALAAEELSAAERALLGALQSAWPGGVHFVEGHGRPQRSARGLALPRHAPDVALAARALARDPGLAAAAVCLLRPPGQRE